MAAGGALQRDFYGFDVTTGLFLPVLVEPDGTLKVSSSGGGGGPVTQATTPWIVDGSGVTQPVSIAALPPVVIASGTVTTITDPVIVQAVNLDIRDLVFAQDTVDVSGSAITVSGSVAVTGPLTDAELRASPVAVTGSFSASTAATATEEDPEYTEGVDENLSQDLRGNLRIRAAAMVSDLPPTLLPGETKPLSLTSDGRLRVAVADARIAEAPFNSDMREMWGVFAAWDNGAKPYYDGSPWAAW